MLSVRGANGFEIVPPRSAGVPEYALLDPDLLATCPRSRKSPPMQRWMRSPSYSESYVSIKANRCTDALAESGFKRCAMACSLGMKAAASCCGSGAWPMRRCFPVSVWPRLA
ncbi:MAG: hypothetical protein IPK63_22775 [Candidatus Competibacteraceae bacterium]|nr:hypothetical protein [Candidatus Competibacteraceae bacterium]